MRNRMLPVCLVLQGLFLSVAPYAGAWEHHPLFTEYVISTMPEVADAAPVEATTLEDFLVAVEADLPAFLAQEEAWARNNLVFYAPRPEALAFEATGNAGDIRNRFFRAIRINPNTKTPLYLTTLSTGTATGPLLESSDVSILQDTSSLVIWDFPALAAGEQVDPLDILSAASNEPDYGMDIGLFSDNATPFGAEYGFGIQAFGNAQLDYGSQAPFHMGFYDESPLVYLFASFLKECYPEQRIHLYKSLSEFAFDHGQDYWGWRFMGWGLHYMGDLSMPYHTTALPGYSTFRMLFINLLDMLGWSKLKDDAMQISSNRHMALEIFQGIVLADAVRANATEDIVISCLLEPRQIPAYSDAVPRKLAGFSHAMAARLDRNIGWYMPYQFVSDPSIELGDLPERTQIVAMMEADHGPEAIAEMKQKQAKAMSYFAIFGRSFVLAILD